MMHVGQDVSITDLQRRKLRRVKRGECPECGTRLFKPGTGVLGRMKRATPLNEVGKCFNGRCLLCFPMNKDEQVEAMKNLPVPKLLECRIGGMMNPNGTMVEEGEASGVGSFVFNYDDNVSDITLDRRIRIEADRENSVSKMTVLSEDTSDQSVRARMAELLRDGGETEAHCNVTYTPSSRGENDCLPTQDSPEQRKHSDTGGLVAKWEAPPEQAPARQHVSASSEQQSPTKEVSNRSNLSDNDNHDPDDIVINMSPSVFKSASNSFTSPEQAPVRRQSLARSRGSVAKKPFLPPWKPPVSNHASSSSNAFVDEEKPIEDITRHQTDEAGGEGATEIFFDSTAIRSPPIVSEAQEQSTDNGDSAINEDSGLNEDGFSEYALDNSSHLDAYDEYSSRLLEMLDNAEVQQLLDEAEDKRFFHGAENIRLQDVKLEPVLQTQPVTSSTYESESDGQAGEKAPTSSGSGTVPTSRPSLHVPSHDGVNPRGSYGNQEEDLKRVSTSSEDTVPNTDADGTGPKTKDDSPDTLRVETERMSPTYPTTTEVAAVAAAASPALSEANKASVVEPFSPRKKPPPGPKAAPTPPIPSDLRDIDKCDSFSFKKVPLLSLKTPPLDFSSARVTSQQESHEIIALLRQLENGRTEDHEAFLSKLTDIIWTEGMPAKQHFSASDGIKILASTMWADMMIPSTERAAAELFLAVAATSSSTVASAAGPLTASCILIGDEATEGLVDALLITMQTLIMDEELQQIGCRILCCLSSSSNDNDGTRSGACLAVLNAIDAHYSSPVVQEWGLRALYNQCVYSKHAGTNKQTLLSSRLSTTGATGGQILESIILQNSVGEFHLIEGGVLEWACKLCWCLTVPGESSFTMAPTRLDTLRTLLHVLEQSRTMEEASVQLQEAVLGMISNFSIMDQNRSFLCTVDVIFLILDVMHGNKEHVEVQIEACSVIANVTRQLLPAERDEIVDNGAVRTIVGAIFAFPEAKKQLHGPALRALLGLVIESEIAKQEICERETLSVLMQNCRMDQNSTLTQQETLCNLLASVFASDILQPRALQCDSFGALTAAMAANSSSVKVQDAVCAAYRNLSKNEENLELFLRGNVVGLVVNAMMRFKFVKSIQANACCILWNIGVGTEFGFRRIAKTNAMSCIVGAIQNHLESQEVVEMACGSLWSMIHGSYGLRQQFLDIESGMESVTCTLVMHPRSTKLLEKACGVLATISTAPQSRVCDVTAESVSNVVETMKHNPGSVELLQYGALFLKNSILRSHELVHEASGAIPVLIGALRHFDRADAFQRETCYFIWSISELSQDAKSRILALDGLSVVMGILDGKGGSVEIVENAALGAFKELALTLS